MELVGIAFSAVAALAGLIAAVAGVRQQRRDSLALASRKEKAANIATEALLSTNWLLMGNGVRQAEPDMDTWKGKIRSQQRLAIQAILAEAYDNV
ncbi:MAG TPA: hypothetical protein VFQ36_24290 [Ktedonobacteraceae bacterium]|nr:hypothetical protein [Ktedonobacteraceae bacterium]